MIRSETEYKEMVKRLQDDRQFIKMQKESLVEMGLTDEEIQRAMAPALSFYEQLKDEVDYYERIKRGEFRVLLNLEDLGRTLIALRIALGISQRELSDRLNVSEAQVSKDERNEYHGVTVEKVQRILNVLQVTLKTEVTDFPETLAS
ncbi:helix-turn-helix protein [Peptococcaceae bacterium CEB3]|nr:helix-turn-helix protein [Peptococcaceae bacterium CEB3]